MKKLLFEITEKKTEVILDGKRTDITDKDSEKILIKLLKKLQSEGEEMQILDAINPDNWK